MTMGFGLQSVPYLTASHQFGQDKKSLFQFGAKSKHGNKVARALTGCRRRNMRENRNVPAGPLYFGDLNKTETVLTHNAEHEAESARKRCAIRAGGVLEKASWRYRVR